MKLIVFGHKRHGKDTVCEILQERHGMTFISSSEFACNKFIFEKMKSRMGYATAQECFDDRVNHRKYWYEAIRDYNEHDRSRLGTEIFQNHDVYCGIRDREEFLSLKNQGLFDYAIWVDASNRLPLEDGDSMNLTSDLANIVLNNNDSLEILTARVDKLALDLKRAEYDKNVIES